MTLIRTTLLSAASYCVKAVAGLITNKIIAVFAGAPGLALLGNFGNFLALLQLVPTSINVGTTKYVAEHSKDSSRMLAHLSTAFLMIAWSGAAISLLLIVSSKQVASLILKDPGYAGVVATAGMLSLFVSLNNFWIAILNGLKEIRNYVIVNITASFITLLVTALLASKWRISGVLLAFSVSQAIVFILTFYFISKHHWASWEILTGHFEKACVSRFLKYSAMIAFSSLLSNVTSLILRDKIMSRLSLDSAGIWQGMLRLSDSYMSIAISSLGVYYLPRLSEIAAPDELKKEIWGGYAAILPTMAACCLVIYSLRRTIVLLLFTDKFLPMTDLFLPQLAGDFLKMFSWLLAYIAVAKAMARWFIFSELLFSCTYLAAGIIFVDRFGLIGVPYAYLLSYLIFSLFLIWLFKFKKRMI